MVKSEQVPAEGRMLARVLSVCGEVFRGKGQDPDVQMFRVYMADAKGRVGYLYTRQEYAAGDLVVLGLAERDGRLRLSVLGLAAQAPQV